jgi:hypothetical protein
MLKDIYVVSTYSICPSNDGMGLEYFAETEEQALEVLNHYLSDTGEGIDLSSPFKFNYKAQEITATVYGLDDPEDTYERQFDFRLVRNWRKE